LQTVVSSATQAALLVPFRQNFGIAHFLTLVYKTIRSINLMKFTLTSLIVASALSTTVTTSHAALAAIYSTDFKSPTYSDAALIGQDGWLITGASVVNALSVTNAATTGNVALTTTGQDVNRPLGSAYNSGSMFVMAAVNVTAAQATGDYFVHLSDGGTSNFYARIYAKSSGAGFSLAMGTSAGTAVTYGSELAFGTHAILFRYDFVTGAGNDTGALFVNPTSPDGTADTAYVNATLIGTDATSISAINLRQGTAGNAPTVSIDSLLVSVPVPETSTAALLLVGCAGLARRRR
jgi:hypothetical protein